MTRGNRQSESLIQRGLSLDLRSLAVYRVAIGTVLLFQLVALIPEIDDFYTDRGILPRDALLSQFLNPWRFSVHLMSGEWVVQFGLFLLAIVFAAGLIVGYRTRVCTVASWFLLTSLQNRNSVILHGGDDVLRLLLFWSMFVPLNGRFSLDQALHPTRPRPKVTHLSWGSQALMLQLCFVYWFAAAAKWNSIWIREGSAIYYAMNLEQLSTKFGQWLLKFPDLLRVMSRSTVVFEFFMPFLALSPVGTARLRLLAVAAFVTFHAALGLVLHLGNFPWVCSAGWLMFLPSEFWDRLGSSVATRFHGIVIYFDDKCDFCRRVVFLLREGLLLHGADFQPAESVPAISVLMRERGSWIVRDNAQALHSGYDALLVLLRQSLLTAWLSPALAAAPVRRVGERVYVSVAGHRSRWSRILRAVTPPVPRYRFGVLTHAIVLSAVALVFAWNLSNFPWMRIERPAIVRHVADLALLGQGWAMFAPKPGSEDGWYVIEGIEFNGTRIDLWRGGGEPNFGKPADVAEAYRDPQWRRYLSNLWDRDYSDYRLYFARYLCRTWNEKHAGPERVNLIYINYMLEITPPPGGPLPPPEQVEIWRHYCFDKPATW
ncbi:MAG TPA: HTTM domain-containing protein [Gemmatimonadales bacterium]